MDKEQIIARCVEACLELEGALRVLAERDDCAEAESLVERCRLQLDTLLDTLLDSQAPEYDVTPVYETTVEPAAEVFLEATDESTAPVVVPAVESEAEPSQTEGADEEAPSDETAEEQPAAGKPRTATDVTINDAYAAMDDEAAPVRPNELRVDEMLSRRGARELRRAFTLNDKFRFRRELFGNDDTLFGETLSVLDSMSDIGEATEYVRDNLGLDPDNEHVADFLSIVANHYAAVD